MANDSHSFPYAFRRKDIECTRNSSDSSTVGTSVTGRSSRSVPRGNSFANPVFASTYHFVEGHNLGFNMPSVESTCHRGVSNPLPIVSEMRAPWSLPLNQPRGPGVFIPQFHSFYPVPPQLQPSIPPPVPDNIDYFTASTSSSDREVQMMQDLHKVELGNPAFDAETMVQFLNSRGSDVSPYDEKGYDSPSQIMEVPMVISDEEVDKKSALRVVESASIPAATKHKPNCRKRNRKRRTTRNKFDRLRVLKTSPRTIRQTQPKKDATNSGKAKRKPFTNNNKETNADKTTNKKEKKKPRTQEISNDSQDISLSEKDLESASFEELMLHYKSIQEQLQQLADEEECRGIATADTQERDEHEIPCSVIQNEDSIGEKLTLGKQHNGDTKNGEEDDDLIELRRLALVSKKPSKDEAQQTAKVSKIQVEVSPKVKVADVDNETEEQALRELLLESLSKRKEIQPYKLTPEVNAKEKYPTIVEMIIERSDTPTSESSFLVNKLETTSAPAIKVSTPESLATSSVLEKKNAPVVASSCLAKSDKLIINFGEDSSDEDEEEESGRSPMPGLDSLLKEARLNSYQKPFTNQCPTLKPASAVTKLSLAQQVEYQKLKEEIARRERNSLSKTSVLLLKENKLKAERTLLEEKKQKRSEQKTKLIQKRIQLRKAQVHARKMQELYLAATRVVSSNAAELNKANNAFKEIEMEICEKEKQLQALELDCLIFGRDVKGNKYNLPKLAPKFVTKASVSAHLRTSFSETDNKYKSNKELAIEKKRLQGLRSIVSERLQVLKGPSKSPAAVATTSTPSTSSKVSNLAKQVADEKRSKEATALEERLSRYRQAVMLTVKKVLSKSVTGAIHVPYEYLIVFLGYPYHFEASYSVEDFRVPSQVETSSEGRWSYNEPNTDNNSVLSHLHAYRLCESYDDGNQVPDYVPACYSNAINPHVYICRFDLLGKCNDDTCTWQHHSKYLLSPDEKLVDLFLYFPSVAHCCDKPDMCQDVSRCLLKFVQSFKSQHSSLTTDALFHRAVCLIREAAKGRPLSTRVRVAPRARIEDVKTVSVHTFDDFKYNIKLKDTDLTLTYGKIFRIKADIDPDNCVKNRFFAPEGRPLSAELETTLAADPHNIQLWVKLAYYHVTRNPTQKSDCINRALNVLSRALEYNKDNPELWQHFLFLYSNRMSSSAEDSRYDILTICEKAVLVCPHFKIWKQYVSYCVTFEDKEVVSSKYIQAIVNNQIQVDGDSPMEKRSHILLEVILYKVKLYLEAGMKQRAQKYFEQMLMEDQPFALLEYESSVQVVCANILKEELDTLTFSNELVLQDRIFSWLCYIYFRCFQSLPPYTAEVFKQGFSDLLNKKPFIIPWRDYNVPEGKIKDILATFKTAIDHCLCSYKFLNMQEKLRACYPVFVNMAYFEVLCARKTLSETTEMFTLLSQKMKSDPDLMILAAEFQSHCGFEDVALTTLNSARGCEIHDITYCYLTAVIYYQLSEYQKARHALLDVAQLCFSSNIQEANLLSSFKILVRDDDEEGEHYHASQYNECSTSVASFSLPNARLRLCYVLLLMLDGAPEDQLEKSFQKALTMCKLEGNTEAEVNSLWWLYLQYHSKRLCHQHQFVKLLSLLRHCCVSVADPLFQMKLIQFFSFLISNEKERLRYFMTFLNLLPENTMLVHYTINFSLSIGETIACYDNLKTLIAKKRYKQFDAELWKTVICLAIERNDHLNVHRYSQLALSAFPYNKILWKLVLTYETSLNHKDHVKEIKRYLAMVKIPNFEGKAYTAKETVSSEGKGQSGQEKEDGVRSK